MSEVSVIDKKNRRFNVSEGTLARHPLMALSILNLSHSILFRGQNKSIHNLDSLTMRKKRMLSLIAIKKTLYVLQRRVTS